jgi:hypothetical protein
MIRGGAKIEHGLVVPLLLHLVCVDVAALVRLEPGAADVGAGRAHAGFGPAAYLQLGGIAVDGEPRQIVADVVGVLAADDFAAAGRGREGGEAGVWRCRGTGRLRRSGGETRRRRVIGGIVRGWRTAPARTKILWRAIVGEGRTRIGWGRTTIIGRWTIVGRRRSRIERRATGERRRATRTEIGRWRARTIIWRRRTRTIIRRRRTRTRT